MTNILRDGNSKHNLYGSEVLRESFALLEDGLDEGDKIDMEHNLPRPR